MKETPTAAQAFEDYYALGDGRSLRKLAKSNQKHSKHIANLMQWSAAHGWQERVKARDREIAEAKRKQKDAAIEAMNERHAQTGMSLQAKGLKRADELLAQDVVSDLGSLRMIKIGTDLERIARSESAKIQANEEKQEGEISLPIVDLLPEEIATLKNMAQSMRERKQKAELERAHETSS